MVTTAEKLGRSASVAGSAQRTDATGNVVTSVPTILAEVLTHNWPRLLPLTAEQYLAAVRAEILPEKAPIELIDGFLIYKDRRDAEGDLITEGERHYLIKNLLRDILDPLVRSLGFHAVTEPPVLLSDISVPEPDVAVFRGRLLDYRGRRPRAVDAAVVIEVARSSLSHDRQTKLERYAAAGVPAYWIVNLESSEVEVYSRPDGRAPRYGDLRTFDRTGTIPLPLFDSGSVNVQIAEFLPE